MVVPEEAEAVRFMFERYVTGRFSFAEIADMVNDRGWRTRAGRRFSKDTVTDMLRNPFYSGKVLYKAGQRQRDVGEMFQGQHEALISEEIWDASVRVRQRHQHRSRNMQAMARPYLLSQLAHCHLCGRNLRAQASDAGGYYREMSYDRGYDDCPNARLGTRIEPLHTQIGAIVRLLQLPPDWQAELAQMIGEGDEVATLANRRGRLIAERRRLKEGFLRGDFEEDEDLYRRELERLRRELEQLPSEEDLVQVKQAAALLESLAEVWDDAEVGDQRDLTQLMLREARVDVAQGRLQLIYPTAPFVPLFRKIPLLRRAGDGQLRAGLAARVGRGAHHPQPGAADFLARSAGLAAVRANLALAGRSERSHQPGLERDPEGAAPGGQEGGAVVAVPCTGVPTIDLDSRKWPEVSLRSLSLDTALALPAGSLACLDTPLVAPSQTRFEELLPRIHALLEQGGYWRFVDLMPPAMPAHWVFTYFPDAWGYVRGSVWTSYKFYNVLREAGFGVKLKEHSYYQPVSLAAAHAIAARREGILATLSDEAYQNGQESLAAEARGRGSGTLIGSEFTLVEILAVKGEQPRPKRRKPSFRKPGEDAAEVAGE